MENFRKLLVIRYKMENDQKTSEHILQYLVLEHLDLFNRETLFAISHVSRWFKEILYGQGFAEKANKNYRIGLCIAWCRAIESEEDIAFHSKKPLLECPEYEGVCKFYIGDKWNCRDDMVQRTPWEIVMKEHSRCTLEAEEFIKNETRRKEDKKMEKMARKKRDLPDRFDYEMGDHYDYEKDYRIEDDEFNVRGFSSDKDSSDYDSDDERLHQRLNQWEMYDYYGENDMHYDDLERAFERHGYGMYPSEDDSDNGFFEDEYGFKLRSVREYVRSKCKCPNCSHLNFVDCERTIAEFWESLDDTWRFKITGDVVNIYQVEELTTLDYAEELSLCYPEGLDVLVECI